MRQKRALRFCIYTRDPKDGRPSQDPGLFRPFLEQIKAATNAVVNITRRR